jgi:hypothetical protein
MADFKVTHTPGSINTSGLCDMLWLRSPGAVMKPQYLTITFKRRAKALINTLVSVREVLEKCKVQMLAT